ncbi:hypothetical protein QBC43DRAFT_213965 [Cladorrhinum sp. PSN259]|nr:hypothetical protein QBC43DRAFT_213965 [Cladorrhinum sp. PSN259]
MADASQLEADLFAALARALPAEPDKPTPTPGDALPPPQTESQARFQQHVVESIPIPSPPPTRPPPPLPAETASPVPSQPPIAASQPTPVTNSFATDSHSMAEPSSTAQGSPSLHFAQFITTSQQHVPPTYPQQEPGALIAYSHAPESSSKRSRSHDPLDDHNASPKRIKKEPESIEQKEGDSDKAHNDVNDDLGALLEAELARHSVIQSSIPADGDVVMHGTDDLQAPVATSVANRVSNELEKTANKIIKASSNPIYIMRSMSLPVLGNVAVQLLVRLSQQSRAETEALLTDRNSDFRKAYDLLRDVFGPTKKIFSDSPLLSADELEITDSEDRETVRMSNLAAIALSAFGANDILLKDVHDNFFTVFIPEEWEYKDSLTDLFLSIKTRLYWDSQETEDGSSVMELLENLFPVNFDESLKQRTGDLLLNPEEERLVDQVRKRREQLIQCAENQVLRESLEKLNSAETVMDHLTVFLQDNLGVVIDYAEKYGVNIPLSEEDAMSLQMSGAIEQKQENDPEDSLTALLQSEAEQSSALEPDRDHLSRLIEQALNNNTDIPRESPEVQHTVNEVSSIDPSDLANFISEQFKNTLEEPHGLPSSSTTSFAPEFNESNHVMHPQYMNQPNQQQSSPYQSFTQNSAPAPTTTGAPGEHLPPHQSLPTAALYEKARQAAVAKTSTSSRREGLHSTRRPWTPEEEKALMAGLDMVKGPHWSQILGLFGPNGTISDILKERTQVQLKDKARNLKLFFLKTNSEMPFYLQSVTGELKTRAPTQAARKEAEERARQNQEEEQARVQGIMTLAGGLQNNHHHVANARLASSPVPRGSPATPGVGGTHGNMATAPSPSTAGIHPQPPVPISPMVKTEPLDHHSMPKVTTFPPIQPAPAPASVAGQQVQPLVKPQLPPLQPQPSPTHNQHSQPQQQQQLHQNQYQQPRQHQQQQTHQPQQQHQQQPPEIHQPHHPQQHLQPQTQAQIQTPTQGPANSQNSQSGQASSVSSHPSQQLHGQAPAQAAATSINHAPTFTLPIPPNHHSTPDHAQDSTLYDALTAAIASADQNQNHTSASIAVSTEGTRN